MRFLIFPGFQEFSAPLSFITWFLWVSLMEKFVVYVALITGNLIGLFMIGAVILVYVKHRKFGFGGSVLTIFATLLIGLSIWQTAEITISPQGGLEAKIESKIKTIIEENPQQFQGPPGPP